MAHNNPLPSNNTSTDNQEENSLSNINYTSHSYPMTEDNIFSTFYDTTDFNTPTQQSTTGFNTSTQLSMTDFNISTQLYPATLSSHIPQ